MHNERSHRTAEQQDKTPKGHKVLQVPRGNKRTFGGAWDDAARAGKRKRGRREAESHAEANRQFKKILF